MGNVFGSAQMTTVRLNRLTHHYHMLKTGNYSFRFKNNSTEARSRTPKVLA